MYYSRVTTIKNRLPEHRVHAFETREQLVSWLAGWLLVNQKDSIVSDARFILRKSGNVNLAKITKANIKGGYQTVGLFRNNVYLAVRFAQ